jgi:hypothetical protein
MKDRSVGILTERSGRSDAGHRADERSGSGIVCVGFGGVGVDAPIRCAAAGVTCTADGCKLDFPSFRPKGEI